MKKNNWFINTAFVVVYISLLIGAFSPNHERHLVAVFGFGCFNLLLGLFLASRLNKKEDIIE